MLDVESIRFKAFNYIYVQRRTIFWNPILRIENLSQNCEGSEKSDPISLPNFMTPFPPPPRNIKLKFPIPPKHLIFITFNSISGKNFCLNDHSRLNNSCEMGTQYDDNKFQRNKSTRRIDSLKCPILNVIVMNFK